MRYARRTYFLIPAVLAMLAWTTAAVAETVSDLGKPDHFVNDYTRVLSSSDKSRLISICEDLEDSNGTQLAIVIINSLDGQSIENLSQELFEKWGIGKKGADNGVLILIAMDDHEWRVHTGYGVEGALPDSLAARIMKNEAVPSFKSDNYGEGLINAATQISNVLEGEEYEYSGAFNVYIFMMIGFILLMAMLIIWLSLRIKCPKCGSRVEIIRDREVLKATYNHAGIKKKDYECTVCHHEFSRMTAIPMMVESTGGSGGGWASSGGSSSSGGFGGFGGFGGGSSGGGGASGGW